MNGLIAGAQGTEGLIAGPQVAMEVYQASKTFPLDARYFLTDQIRRFIMQRGCAHR